MNKTLLASGIALALMTSSAHLMAEEGYEDEDYLTNTAEINTVKGGVTFGTAAIVGGIVAGPLGVMVGAIGGTFLAEELDKAEEYDIAMAETKAASMELAGAEMEISVLKNQVEQLQQESNQQHDLAVKSPYLENLEFQLLFHTGNDTLSEESMRRLDSLASFLKSNPELNVRLHGHADPRGTDGYNNILSLHRALNVQNALEFYGVDPERLERYSYGADKSIAPKGDLDAYALERRVTVQIVNPQEGVAIAD